MKRYKCQLCDYETNQKSRIHIHHIIPREKGGKNNRWNLVYLCPNHHAKIYCEDSQHGIHTNKKDCIKIIGWFSCTQGSGKTLMYIDQNGKEQFSRIINEQD